MFGHHGPGDAATAIRLSDVSAGLVGAARSEMAGDRMRQRVGCQDARRWQTILRRADGNAFRAQRFRGHQYRGMERCEPSLTIKLGGEQYKQGVEAAAPSVGGRLPMAVPR